MLCFMWSPLFCCVIMRLLNIKRHKRLFLTTDFQQVLKL